MHKNPETSSSSPDDMPSDDIAWNGFEKYHLSRSGSGHGSPKTDVSAGPFGVRSSRHRYLRRAVRRVRVGRRYPRRRKVDGTRLPPTNVQHCLALWVSWTLEPSPGWRLFVASSLSIACYLCRSEMTCVLRSASVNLDNGPALT